MDEVTERRLTGKLDRIRTTAAPFLEERAMLQEAGDLPVVVDARLLLQLLDAVEAL